MKLKNLLRFELLSLLFILIVPNFGHAEVVPKLFDINKVSDQYASSNPRNFFTTNNYLYFISDKNTYTLHRTDGTANGTIDLKTNMGFCGEGCYLSYRELGAIGNTFYFFKYNELWKTNGTVDGTYLVRSFNGSNNSSSSYKNGLEIHGYLYFMANDGLSDGLWKTDGTESGTTLVYDGFSIGHDEIANIGNYLYFSSIDSVFKVDLSTNEVINISNSLNISISYPYNFTILNNLLYFIANSNNDGANLLFRTDGTIEGTFAIKGIDENNIIKSPKDLIIFNNNLYYTAYDLNGIASLYKTDGTEFGVSLIKLGASGDCSGEGCYSDKVIFNSYLYFTYINSESGAGELWKTDGTESGNVLVRGGFYAYNSSVIDQFSVVNNILYFATANGQLWTTDGTLVGTTLIKENIATCQDEVCKFPFMVGYNNNLFFNFNGVSNVELWKTNGTESGTSFVKSVNNESKLFIFKNAIYFSGDDGIRGYELWKTKGSSSSTLLLKDIININKSSYANKLTNFNGVLYFVANDIDDDSNNSKLFKIDNSKLGYSSISNNIKGVSNLYVFNNKLYFSGMDNSTSKYYLYNIDKNKNITQVFDFGTDYVSSIVYSSDSDQILYLSFNNDGYLRKIDGLNDSIVVNVKQFDVIMNPVTMDGVLYFGNNNSLWRSDGTDNGTVVVKSSTIPENITRLNNIIYFVANGMLWKSDGTESGTTAVHSVFNNSGNYQLTPAGNLLYFVSDNRENPSYDGSEIWRTDGTESGTYMVKDLYQGYSSPNITNLTNLNGVLYFTEDLGSFYNGYALYKTDGTESGTVLVKQLTSYSWYSQSDFKVYNGLDGNIYFNIESELLYSNRIDEIWKTDGTEIGTEKVYGDVENNLSGTNIINVDGIMYFTMSSTLIGNELYRLPGKYFSSVSYDKNGSLVVKNKLRDTVSIPPTNRSNYWEDAKYKYLEKYHDLNGLELKKFEKNLPL